MATVAFYGPNLSQQRSRWSASAIGDAEVKELRDWKVDHGDIRADPAIACEILEFMEKHGVLSVAMTDTIIGCPHQEGNRLRRRMVSGLRVLARTETAFRTEVH